ncbi:hypothetical protein IB235_19965 [Paracoccus sp. PAR01]|nr:hypothetical protein [Paracoccus sp. PAR01]
MNTGLSEADYASIGRVVANFSLLEHEILLACYSLIECEVGNAEDNIDALYMRYEPIVSGAFKKRSEQFVKLIQPHCTERFVKKLTKILSHTQRFRDHFAHGVWMAGQDGKIECGFFSRKGMAEGYPEDRTIMTRSDLDSLASLVASTLMDVRRLERLITSAPFGPTERIDFASGER